MWHRNIQENQIIERQAPHDLPIFVLPLLRRYDKLLFNQLVDDIKQQFATWDTRIPGGTQWVLVLIRRYASTKLLRIAATKSIMIAELSTERSFSFECYCYVL
jgi:hypothetical protein